jgi:hypothetical protein
MDYEKHYTYTNPRVLFIIIILILGFNYYIHPMDIIFKKPVVVNQTPVNNTIVIYRNITVTVTPTPDGKTYFAGEYESGIRKLGRYFSWFNKDVQGKEDMSGHVKVYDVMYFDSLHIFNPSDYTYYEIRPSDDTKQYCFVFVKIYLDDIIGDNTPLWLPTESHFYLQSKDKIYNPITWEKQLRIKELEETWNDNNNFRIGYYGVFNTYSRDLRYKSTAGEYAQDIYYVIGGESNAIDGYIIYEIPKGSKPDENLVLMDLYSFGQPSWKLIR